MKRALSLLVVAVMCIGLFAGCTNNNADTPSVYWLNFKPESDQVLLDVAKMYTEETGIEVKVVTAASGTYNQTLIAEMEKTNAPTLFVIGNQAAVKDWKDYAVDLTDTAIANELNTDAYNMYDEDGKLVWKCPNCENTDESKMNVARRTCGYIGTQYWNQGRTQEIKERVLHL